MFLGDEASSLNKFQPELWDANDNDCELNGYEVEICQVMYTGFQGFLVVPVVILIF